MNRKKLKIWLSVVGIAIFLTFMDSRGWFNWLKLPIAKMVNPIKHKVYLEKAGGENVADRHQAQLAIIEAELEKTRNENQKLRELLETKLPPSWKFVPAKVIKLDRSEMLIDVGTKMDVKENMAVIALKKKDINNGIVIGQISQSSLTQSKVQLFNHKDSLVQVKTVSGAEGVIIGDGKTFRLGEVLQESVLEEAELILTRGADGWLPGLVVGKMGRINKVDTEIFQSAEVEPILPISELTGVFVVSN